MGTSYNPKIITNNLVLSIDPANIKSYSAGQDSYVNSVSLMLDGESLNDSSQNGFTITNSNVTVSSAQYKYGNSSLYFNGTTSYLSLNGESAFSFGTGDFTIETWYYPSDTNTEDTIYDTRPLNTNSSSYFTLRRKSDGSLSLLVNGIDLITGGTTTSSWQHVALCRSSGTTRLFLNGTQVGSSTFSLSYAITAGRPFIGAESYTPSNNTFTLTGYLDDFRVTKAARYTANFTPPAGPLALPGRITDLTKNKATASFLNGPIYASGNVIFDGVNDYINIPSSTNLTFGTGDFTMEVWFKTRAKTMLYPTVLGINAPYAANVWVLCDRHNSTPTKFTFHVANIASPLLTSLTTPSNGNWYQVVITRISNTWSMYVNGSLEATASSAGSLDGGVSTSINLGRESASDNTYYDGNISILRMYKNKGLTSNEVLQNYNATKGRFGL